jgi:hypothetical protein
MRIVVLAEGSTERTALEPFLHRAIKSRTRRSVGISVVDGRGASKLRKDLLQRVTAYLDASQRTQIAGVVALFDLLSPPELFAQSSGTNEVRMDAACKEIEREISDDRFRLAFACPETEAWLLADPAIFPQRVRSLLTERLTNAPEGMTGKPSEELNALYLRGLNKAYRKTIDGRNLFAKLDPERVAERCPRFKKLLEAIVELVERV